MFKGARICVAGELIAKQLGLPKDAEIFKIVPSKTLEYSYDVFFFSKEGYEVPEGGVYPLVILRDRKIDEG